MTATIERVEQATQVPGLALDAQGIVHVRDAPRANGPLHYVALKP